MSSRHPLLAVNRLHIHFILHVAATDNHSAQHSYPASATDTIQALVQSCSM